MHHNHHDKELGVSVKTVLDYIHRNLDGDLRLEVLARIANYSPFHFQRLFSEHTGVSPKRYVVRQRLELASQYLRNNPAMSISEVAASSGFALQSSFSRAFRNFFGQTPENYREQSTQ